MEGVLGNASGYEPHGYSLSDSIGKKSVAACLKHLKSLFPQEHGAEWGVVVVEEDEQLWRGGSQIAQVCLERKALKGSRRGTEGRAVSVGSLRDEAQAAANGHRSRSWGCVPSKALLLDSYAERWEGDSPKSEAPCFVRAHVLISLGLSGI